MSCWKSPLKTCVSAKRILDHDLRMKATSKKNK